MHDSISDLLTRIRNAGRAGHDGVEVPHSLMKERIGALLVAGGYLKSMVVTEGKPKKIVFALKYRGKKIFAIREILRVSRPGRRVYSGFKGLKPVYGGLGMVILSTPQGVMTDAKAREIKVGGEIVCQVW